MMMETGHEVVQSTLISMTFRTVLKSYTRIHPDISNSNSLNSCDMIQEDLMGKRKAELELMILEV